LRLVLELGGEALEYVYSTDVDNVIFEDLEPADLNNRICYTGFVLVAGQKSVLDALHNDALEVACSGSVDKVLLELSDELVAPS
jgi:hypothetical protein